MGERDWTNGEQMCKISLDADVWIFEKFPPHFEHTGGKIYISRRKDRVLL